MGERVLLTCEDEQAFIVTVTISNATKISYPFGIESNAPVVDDFITKEGIRFRNFKHEGDRTRVGLKIFKEDY